MGILNQGMEICLDLDLVYCSFILLWLVTKSIIITLLFCGVDFI